VKKKVVVLVSNDLSFDRRVEKTCELWINAGWDVELVGVKKPNSQPITRGYKTKRLRTLFSKGVGFYAVLQIRLFFHLLFKKTNVVWSNDLDTLLPARLICALRGIDLIYDSHEWFTEAEGLTGRPFIKSVWKGVERLCIPGLQRCLTVNVSIAEIYRSLYRVNMQVVRNVPTKWNRDTVVSHIALQPGPKIILQGAYIDPDRGGEELVQAMQYLPDVTLYVIGSGRAIPEMKTMDSSNVVFMDRLLVCMIHCLLVCLFACLLVCSIYIFIHLFICSFVYLRIRNASDRRRPYRHFAESSLGRCSRSS
jgi:hypothetical protein